MEKKTKWAIQRLSESNSSFSEDINNIDKTLPKITKRKKERMQIKEIRDERGENKTDITEIKRMIRDYF